MAMSNVLIVGRGKSRNLILEELVAAVALKKWSEVVSLAQGLTETHPSDKRACSGTLTMIGPPFSLVTHQVQYKLNSDNDVDASLSANTNTGVTGDTRVAQN